METGKTGKYLKYALGEIVLVVIGILIALQINNWNESRKNKNKEVAILKEINREFKKNKTQLDTVIFKHKIVVDNAHKIINLLPINLEEINLDSLSIYINNTFTRFTFDPTQGSINALVNSSSFNIIQNDDLRHLLISWNDQLTDYQEEEIRSRNFADTYYDPFFNAHFDWDLNFKDGRTDVKVLQTLLFDNLIRNRSDLVEEIIHSPELILLKASVNQIIELSEAKAN